MTPPMLPELPMIEIPLPEMKQRLLALRKSLERACYDLDLQLAALGTNPACSSSPLNAIRPQTSIHEPSVKCTRSLFEAPPSGQCLTRVPSSTHSRVIEAANPGDLDPLLEQATLEELNSALSQAFSQIAMKRDW
jgi:hypothetical protein